MKSLPLLFDDSPGEAPPAAPGTLARGLAAVAAIWLVTRLVVWVSAYCGALLYVRIDQRLDSPLSKHIERLQIGLSNPLSPEYRVFHREIGDLQPLLNFDGKHYRTIVRGGYQYKPVGPGAQAHEREQNIAFFPLYPLVCMPLVPLMGVSAAMILVAHLASLAAAVLIYLWVRRRIDESTALFTVACVFCLPAACYYSFGYAESVTLLTTVVTLMLIDRRRWAAAAIACAFATATRPTAAGLVAVLAIGYWFASPASRGRRAMTAAILGVIGAAGALAYGAYLTYRFDSPMVYFTNFKVGWVPDSKRGTWLEFLALVRVWEHIRYFRDAILGFPAGLVKLAEPFAWNLPINVGILFVSLAGLKRVPRSFRPLLLLGPFIFLHAYLASGGAKFGVEPITRYMAVSVSAFIVLAAWAMREWRPAARAALIAGMVLLQASWALHFGLQEWSG
jgi:Gpi18-like mannosyltransferase